MILRGSVLSKILKMETGITIVAPNNLKMDGNYKVAYLLHGLYGNNGSWADYTVLPVYSDDYDIIFIMPEVARSFYTDMKYGLKFFTYVTDELPNICKSFFNISAERENTIVIGGSMGGYGALKCALSKPMQYGVCIAFSSACLFLREILKTLRETEKAYGLEEINKIYGEQLIRDFKSIFGDNFEYNPNNEILELAKKINKEIVKPKIYTACGTEDYLHEENLRFSTEMETLDFSFDYEEWNGAHDWYFFDKALRKTLKKVFR